jgi:hypothetical protein
MATATRDDERDTAERSVDEILEELRTRYDYALNAWQDIRDAAAIDMRYVAGDTWDDDDKKLRTGRLTLKFDQLSQYLNQLTNTVRQNKRAIKVTQEGNGANEQTAQLREGRIRQIEYLSHAQEAFSAAFAGAAERSYGYCRILSTWEPKSFTKSLRIRAIPNPDQVLPDPDAESVAGADWKYLFFTYELTFKEFGRDFPDAEIRSFTPAVRASAENWIGDDRVKVAEYWTVTPRPETLLQLEAEGQTFTVYERELRERVSMGRIPPGAHIINEREEEVPFVCQYLTNGIELLKKRGQKSVKTEWPGRYIPFAACYGKILYRTEGGHTKKEIQSYVRLGRDAAKYYNWVKSTEGEVISMPPKTPYMAYRGTLAPDQLMALQSATHTPVPVILVEPLAEGTGERVLPMPRRELPEPPIQAYEVAAEAARRDIQNALGRYSTQDHRLGSTKVTSGIALKELDKAGDQGSYHFLDNYNAMIAHVGVMLDDLLEHYDDTAGEITIRERDESVKQVRVNEPVTDPQTGQTAQLRMDQGTHSVTISTGPSFDSEREAAQAFAETLIESPLLQMLGPQKAPQILALAIRAKNGGPLIDQIADLIDPAKPQGEEPMMNAQAMAGQLQEVTARLQQAEQVIAMKQADAQIRLQIAQMEIQKDLQIAEMESARALAIKKLELMAAGMKAENEAQLEAIALSEESQRTDAQLAHEERLTARQHAHEAATMVMDHDHSREMASAEPSPDES